MTVSPVSINHNGPCNSEESDDTVVGLEILLDSQLNIIMYLKLAKRALFETDKRLLWKVVTRMGWKGMRSVQKHKKRMKQGEYFPPFLYVSVINSCNLRCQGCWVDVAAKQQTIDLEAMNRLINEAKAMGNVFFGIVGGEPFMHPQLFEILEAHPDCYFQVFTNGHFITDEKGEATSCIGQCHALDQCGRDRDHQ